MNWYLNLSTMKKLLLGFLAVAAIAGTVGYVGFSNVSQMDQLLGDMYQEQLLGVSRIKEINVQIMYIAREIREAIITPGEAQTRLHREKTAQYLAKLKENMAAVEKSHDTEQGRREFNTLQEAMPVYVKLVDRIYAFTAANQPDKAAKELREAGPTIKRMFESPANMARIKEETAARMQAESNAQASQARMQLLWISAASVAVALVLGFFTAQTIARPLNRAVEVCQAVAQGDYSERLDIHTADEVGQMATALNRSIDATVQLLDNVKQAAEREKEAQAREAEQERQRAQEEQRRKEEEAARERARLEEERRRQEEQATRDRQQAEHEQMQAAELRRKVDHLLEVVGAAAKGDLTQTVTVEGKEPVDELAAGIARMLHDLSRGNRSRVARVAFRSAKAALLSRSERQLYRLLSRSERQLYRLLSRSERRPYGGQIPSSPIAARERLLTRYLEASLCHVSESFGQMRNRHTERPCYGFDIAKGHVALTAFNSADVGSVEAALVGKRFLRNPLRLPQFADAVAEPFEDAGAAHTLSLCALHT
jgi:methyl-accepting chemotaxis protein